MRRRKFLEGAATGFAALAASSAGRVLGANERIGLALIGCGGRGRRVASDMAAAGGAGFVAACDVYETNARRAKAALGDAATTHSDFRRTLERAEVDAVLIATPDHWHATIAVLACRAGKHVYLEKPFAYSVREGQAAVKAAGESGVVFLTGTQQRSAPHIAEAAAMVRAGRLGEVRQVHVWNAANRMPDGIGSEPDSPVPDGLDWDFWLGPAPAVPFNRKRFLGTFREFSDYAGGRITDFGTHRFDSVHQIMGDDAPRRVAALGGRLALGGMGDQPDVLEVTYEYARFVLSYSMSLLNGFGRMGRITPGRTYYGAVSGRGEGRPNGMAFFGTEATLLVDRTGWELIPEPPRPSRARAAPSVERAHVNATDATALHAAHFVRCVSGDEKPRSDALTGHRATLVGHLGTIAWRAGRTLEWDAASETLGGVEAPERWLGRAARPPWNLLDA